MALRQHPKRSSNTVTGSPGTRSTSRGPYRCDPPPPSLSQIPHDSRLVAPVGLEPTRCLQQRILNVRGRARRAAKGLFYRFRGARRGFVERRGPNAVPTLGPWPGLSFARSGLASSEIAVSSGARSPRPSSAAVRAARRYRLIMMLDLWPVRSEIHASVRPFARAMVMNVARRSCTRIQSRSALRSKSCPQAREPGPVLAAVSEAHRAAGKPSPREDAAVRAVRAGIRRTHGTAQRQVAPATTDTLRRMLDHVGRHLPRRRSARSHCSRAAHGSRRRAHRQAQRRAGRARRQGIRRSFASRRSRDIGRARLQERAQHRADDRAPQRDHGAEVQQDRRDLARQRGRGVAVKTCDGGRCRNLCVSRRRT
jgi:hypothetical protein